MSDPDVKPVAGSDLPESDRIPVGVSNRHVHLSAADCEALFGPGFQLTKLKDLKQVGEFATNEKVDVIGPKGEIRGIRVLGPLRPQTQIEVAVTDAYKLGVVPPTRLSGNLEGTPGVKIRGTSGEVDLPFGLIVAANHVHATEEEAALLGIKDGDVLRLRAHTDRPVTFESVSVRVRPTFRLEFHIDTDEANAGLIKNNDFVEILRD